MGDESHQDHGSTWLEREVAHARQAINTAKIVVSFTVATAAAFVVAELQVEHSNPWEIAAAIFIIPALFYTYRIVTLPPQSHEAELDRCAYQKIKAQADDAHSMMKKQVVLSAMSGFVAALGLLIPTLH